MRNRVLSVVSAAVLPFVAGIAGAILERLGVSAWIIVALIVFSAILVGTMVRRINPPERQPIPAVSPCGAQAPSKVAPVQSESLPKTEKVATKPRVAAGAG